MSHISEKVSHVNSSVVKYCIGNWEVLCSTPALTNGLMWVLILKRLRLYCTRLHRLGGVAIGNNVVIVRININIDMNIETSSRCLSVETRTKFTGKK